MSWTVDGTPLSAYAYRVTAKGTTVTTPSVRGQNSEVPARHGALYVPGKKYAPGELTLRMWVRGDDPADFRRRYDTLLRLFSRRNGLIRLRYSSPAGYIRIADVERLDSIEYKTPFTRQAALAVVLSVPGAFWRDATAKIWSSPEGIGTGDQLAMPTFTGASAPMADLLWLVTGPAAAPKVTVLATGAYVAYSGTLAAGEQWRIDAAAWTSVVGEQIGFEAAGDSVIGQTTHAGSARLLELPPPDSDSEPVVELSAGNTSTATQLQARGARAYLLA